MVWRLNIFAVLRFSLLVGVCHLVIKLYIKRYRFIYFTYKPH